VPCLAALPSLGEDAQDTDSMLCSSFLIPSSPPSPPSSFLEVAHQHPNLSARGLCDATSSASAYRTPDFRNFAPKMPCDTVPIVRLRCNQGVITHLSLFLAHTTGSFYDIARMSGWFACRMEARSGCKCRPALQFMAHRECRLREQVELLYKGRRLSL
jgi:hypothetical protein